MVKKTNWFLAAVLFLSLCLSSNTCQAVQPYDNWALPDGWLLSAYPTYYSASSFKNKNGDTSIPDLGSRVHQAALRATYYTKTLLPHTVGFTAFAPIGNKELLGKQTSGIGDATIGMGYWLIDEPAAKTYFVAGMYADIPLGEYDKTKTVTMGKNVWKIRPAIGAAKQFGRADFELSLFYNWYDKNRDTNVTEGSEAIFEWYAGYGVRPDLMVGVMFNSTFGRDKVSQGTRIPDSGIRKFQAGPSLFWKVNNKTNITLSALSEFGVKNSSEGSLFTCRVALRL